MNTNILELLEQGMPVQSEIEKGHVLELAPAIESVMKKFRDKAEKVGNAKGFEIPLDSKEQEIQLSLDTKKIITEVAVKKGWTIEFKIQKGDRDSRDPREGADYHFIKVKPVNNNS